MKLARTVTGGSDVSLQVLRALWHVGKAVAGVRRCVEKVDVENTELVKGFKVI